MNYSEKLLVMVLVSLWFRAIFFSKIVIDFWMSMEGRQSYPQHRWLEPCYALPCLGEGEDYLTNYGRLLACLN